MSNSPALAGVRGDAQCRQRLSTVLIYRGKTAAVRPSDGSLGCLHGLGDLVPALELGLRSPRPRQADNVQEQHGLLCTLQLLASTCQPNAVGAAGAVQ